MKKQIHFTLHALLSLKKRGAAEEEAKQSVTEGNQTPAKYGRLEAAKTFSYNGLWNGNHYRWKQVVPIFVEELDRIVVITVYVFYF